MNEKGLTLVEVLASVVIFFIILGICGYLFVSVQSFWKDSNNRSSYSSMTTLTSSTLNREMADATRIHMVNQNVLQFQKFDGTYEELAYNPAAKSLDLYKMAGATGFSPSPSLQSIANLSTQVSNFTVKSGGNPLFPSTPDLSNGQTIVISLTFNTNAKVSNTSLDISVKLFSQ